MAEAFKKIFSQGRQPEKLWTDKAEEFYNKEVRTLLESRSVELYSTENEEKSCVVERWNKTMKEKMFNYFSANNTRKYIDVLDEMVNSYNNTKHSSIKMTPVEGSLKKNETTVFRNLYPIEMQTKRPKPKFVLGDEVRITKKKTVFEKGYLPRWTEEVFLISKVLYTNPPT